MSYKAGDVELTLTDLYGDKANFEFFGIAKGLGMAAGNQYFDFNEEDTIKLYEFLKARLEE